MRTLCAFLVLSSVACGEVLLTTHSSRFKGAFGDTNRLYTTDSLSLFYGGNEIARIGGIDWTSSELLTLEIVPYGTPVQIYPGAFFWDVVLTWSPQGYYTPKSLVYSDYWTDGTYPATTSIIGHEDATLVVDAHVPPVTPLIVSRIDLVINEFHEALHTNPEFSVYDIDFTLYLYGPEPVPGDLNGDQVVSNSDLTLLLNNWGRAIEYVSGYPVITPVIDNFELTSLLNNWGSISAVTAATIPEPSTLALLTPLGLFAVVVRKRISIPLALTVL